MASVAKYLFTYLAYSWTLYSVTCIYVYTPTHVYKCVYIVCIYKYKYI